VGPGFAELIVAQTSVFTTALLRWSAGVAALSEDALVSAQTRLGLSRCWGSQAPDEIFRPRCRAARRPVRAMAECRKGAPPR
jgi:hypothetical protein